MIRIFDILLSIMGIIVLFPLFFIIYLFVIIESKGGGFYTQNRVGKDGVDFKLFKFRTMYMDSDINGLLTIGRRDSRLTKIGFVIRKYKIDELPQLFNVLIGDMSLVGPRPEVRKYVNLYTKDQLEVLKIRPGLTDYASIKYSNENSILGDSKNPELVYINEIMHDKINLNMKYIQTQSIHVYFLIIFKTIYHFLEKLTTYIKLV